VILKLVPNALFFEQGHLSGYAREVAQFIRVVGGAGVLVAIVKIRGHAVPFCDVDATLCDVDGGGVDV